MLPLDKPLEQFRARVLARGRELYRDLPWRNTRDPYAVWISEVMLQQTQVSRVDGRWQHWMLRFPTIEALAAAESADVLEEWQGMGYNRRALGLRRAALQICSDYQGAMPQQVADLITLPGIGPATAAGIRAFAYNLPGIYLETNVRAVFLHELFPGFNKVPDKTLEPLVELCCPDDAADPTDDPRTWYYALLDYGAYLKKTVPNPSRRSKTHVRQSTFEGSHRQKRAEVLRILLAARDTAGLTFETISEKLNAQELKAGRSEVAPEEVQKIMGELQSEGFCCQFKGLWRA